MIKKIPDEILIVYLRGDLIIKKIHYNENEMKDLIDILNSIKGDIANSDYSPSLGRHCQYCSFSKMICTEFD